MAPDIDQAEVIDHYRGEEDRSETNIEMGGHSRNVLAESARIVRGKIIAAAKFRRTNWTHSSSSAAGAQ